MKLPIRKFVNSSMPAFYNAGVERRRIPHERARWLSAVLIVTAIVGAAAAVRLWPVPPVLLTASLASRPLPLIHAPALALPAPLVIVDSVQRQLEAPQVLADVAPLVIAQAPIPSPDVAEPSEVSEVSAVVVVPLLASRRLEIPLDLPAANFRIETAAAAPDDSRPIMELPAVAVTRVVSVAGRGIRTGVRATTAVFRAAF
jgi:hypothetical protein